MIPKDLEKRLEEIEVKIEELEDMVLENKLKIMNIISGRRVPETNIEYTKRISTTQKKGESEKAREVDDLKERVEKIKNMLRELK